MGASVKRKGCSPVLSGIILALALVVYGGCTRGPTEPAAPIVTPDTPEGRAQAVLETADGAMDITRVSVIEVGSPKLLAMDFDMRASLSGYNLELSSRNMLEMACALYAAGYAPGWQYQFSAMVDLIDKSTGKTWTDDGLTVRVTSARVGGWNCANVAQMDARAAVDEYQLNPVMSQ
jgi:hypothetical protein